MIESRGCFVVCRPRGDIGLSSCECELEGLRNEWARSLFRTRKQLSGDGVDRLRTRFKQSSNSILPPRLEDAVRVLSAHLPSAESTLSKSALTSFRGQRNRSAGFGGHYCNGLTT